MKRKGTFLATILLGVAGVVNAQTWISDSVQMGANTPNDVFYSMPNGTVKTESNSNWFMALQTAPMQAGIWANHVNGVTVFNPHKSGANWASITLADTINAQYNSDNSYNDGALNRSRVASVAFDYGWGAYNATTHIVKGDSIFIVAQAGQYYKVIVDSLVASVPSLMPNYYIRVGVVGSPIPTMSYTFSALPKYATSNFIYISAGMTGLTDTAREPNNANWDILFNKYYTNISPGPGPYPVRGVFSNYGTKTARVQNVAVDTLNNIAYTTTLDSALNVIGYTWKTLVGSAYVCDDTLNSYLVKAKDGKLYQIVFTGYSTITGVVNFKKRAFFPLAINDVNNLATSFGVYPNPTNTHATISIEAKENTEATLLIVDAIGRTIVNKNVNITAGLNAFGINVGTFAKGIYNVAIQGKNIKTNAKLLVN